MAMLLSRIGPLPRAALTSTACMVVGDVACQCISQRQRRSSDIRIDWARTARFGVIGLTLHGPFFFRGFQMLDTYFGKGTSLKDVVNSSTTATVCTACSAAVMGLAVLVIAILILAEPFVADLPHTLKKAVIKSLAGQVTLFPTYTSLVLMYATLLEGGDLRQGLEKVRERLPKLFIVGSVYWPIVNLINFMYVPATRRVLAVNVGAMAWNSYLSYMAAAPVSAVPADK